MECTATSIQNCENTLGYHKFGTPCYDAMALCSTSVCCTAAPCFAELQNYAISILGPGLYEGGIKPVVCRAIVGSLCCWYGLNMSFSSTMFTTGAAGGGGGAFSLAITLRRACRRGDFYATV